MGQPVCLWWQDKSKRSTTCQRRVVLQIDSKVGHGAGKAVTKKIEEFTDVYSFLFWQLGVKP